MGEAKRRNDRMTEVEKLAVKMHHDLANQGKVLAGGFEALKILNAEMVNSSDIPLMEHCYYSGADHVIMTLLNVLDEGNEPSERDMKRFDQIMEELLRWREAATFRYRKPEGSA